MSKRSPSGPKPSGGAPSVRQQSQQQTQAIPPLPAMPAMPARRSAAVERSKARFTPNTQPLDGPGFREPPHAALPPSQVGLTRREATALKAQAVKTETDIYVRDGNPARLPHVGRKGTRPKPAGLYNKTDKTGGFPGLVVTGSEALDNHSGLGFHPEPSGLVRDSHGNTVHGDIDLQRVDRGGRAVPAPEYLEGINRQLRRFSEMSRPQGPERPFTSLRVRPSDKVQHAAHDEWEQRSSMTYAGGRNAGPLPGVTRFSASGRDVHFSTTAEYHAELRTKAAGSTYTDRAWERGEERDATVTQRHVSSLQVRRLEPK